MIPTRKTRMPLRMRAYIGTPSEECTDDIFREKKRASSRAKDQVSREAVWWTALIATQEITNREAMNTVAAAGECVAFSQIK